MSERFDQAQQLRARAALHAAVLLFGFAGLFGKWLALPPLTIVFGRTIVAAAALALLAKFIRDRTPAVRRFEWRLVAGGALLALHWVAFFQAIQTASVAIGLLGFASFPLFVLLLEALLRQRSLHFREWITAGCVTAGLLLLVPEFRLSDPTLRGLLWGVASGFSFALLALGNRALAGRRAASAIALCQNATAAICLLPFAVFTSVVPNAREVALLVLLGVACTALAHTLFILSLRALSAHTASVVAALEPVYGIALAFLFLGETPSVRTLAGAALIVGAAVQATRHATPEARSLG